MRITNESYMIGYQGENYSRDIKYEISDNFKDFRIFIEFEKPNGEKFTTKQLENNKNGTYKVPYELLNECGNLEVQLVGVNEDGIIHKSMPKTFYVSQSINATDELIESENGWQLVEDIYSRGVALKYDEKTGLVSLLGKDKNGNDIVLSSIDLPSEKVIKSIYYDEEKKSLVFEFDNYPSVEVKMELNGFVKREVTYEELVALRDNSQLVAGQQYRIIDYVTTTSQRETRSAGHQFDIIVTALDNHTLDENAMAIQHNGDTYFANSNLSVWELKYTLDNNKKLYNWADNTNGKGVIYYLKDEFNNECYFDFKNIQFVRGKDGEEVYEYLFTFEENDASIDGSCLGNIVKPFENETNVSNSLQPIRFGKNCKNNVIDYQCYNLKLGNGSSQNYFNCCNNITLEENCIHNFFDYGSFSIKLGNNCIHNEFNKFCQATLGDNSSYNKIGYRSILILGVNCNYNIIGNYSKLTCGDNCYSNKLGDNCMNVVFGEGCFENTFGNNCYDVTFAKDCIRNIFGNNCHTNKFNVACELNIFGNSCYGNTFGNDCDDNVFGNCCFENTFSYTCHRNIFGNMCRYNNFGHHCVDNRFSNHCNSNKFGVECRKNDFGNNCNENTFGDECVANKFGNECGNYDKEDETIVGNTFNNKCSHNVFENKCHSNTFGSNCQANYLQNISRRINLATNCSYNTFLTICSDITLGYESIYNHFNSRSQYITLGKYSQYNAFGIYCTNITIEDYSRYNVIENGVKYINLVSGSTSSNRIQYYTIATSGLESTPKDIAVVRNRSFKTRVEKDKDGKILVWYQKDENTREGYYYPSISSNERISFTTNNFNIGNSENVDIESDTQVPSSKAVLTIVENYLTTNYDNGNEGSY